MSIFTLIAHDLCKENNLYSDELAGINVLENADAGLIINADGKILENGFETVQAYDEEGIMPLYSELQEAILNKYTNYSYPTTITVYCNLDSSNRVYTVDFGLLL